MSKEDEFVGWIQENEAIIFKITTIYTNNGENQKDLYQEIVYQLWKSFDSFQNRSKVSTWIYRVALNTAITRKKKEKRSASTLPIEQIVLDHTNMEQDVEQERLQIMYAHIRQLNELEKGIILLFLEGKSHEEIANIIGLSKTNIGTKISRIKQKLKKSIIAAAV